MGRKGEKRSLETRRKISEGRKGKYGGKNAGFYGRKHTEKSKEEIRQSRLGVKLSESHKKAIGLSSLGRVHSEKTRQKISLGNKLYDYPAERIRKATEQCLINAENNRGIPRPLEVREKIRQSNIGKHQMHGSLNSNWRGGLSYEPYCEIWVDQDYKRSIFERDGYQCQNPDCWHVTKRLCAHHIDYNKKNCCFSNLITLCYSCNSRANFNREFWKEKYQILMSNME